MRSRDTVRIVHRLSRNQLHVGGVSSSARKIVSDNRPEDMPSSARDGPLSCSSPLAVQTYCGASFAPGGGRSRSGILVLLVDQKTNRASALLWQSRRQTLTALSAPEAEVVLADVPWQSRVTAIAPLTPVQTADRGAYAVVKQGASQW